MIETDKVNELLCKHKISPMQIYILWLLYTKDTTNMKNYIETFGQFEEKDFDELEEKGLIVWTNRQAGSHRTVDIFVSLAFVEELAQIDPEDAYEELFYVYPANLVVNGVKYPAKGLTLSDEKACKESYKKAISKNKFLHQKVLVAVNKWKEQNGGYAIMKIDKFVTARYWEEIDKEEDSGTAKPSYY